ncbi:RBBP9/YdeN family alpha/beta hydrolase [Paenarthrobacter nitroguajacolicus]|uniref:RBBP9/YdeN family alpha/beta hydrolase n=1 Tax=Paenarthrobacter nitroguajacolicus TaxID=211146 RepID=UPI000B1EB01B|nr:alpha/beta hydrolase [Paenarthrobacter nitroguajacolicus]NWL10786.1 serine hydrolase family protein [Paenarthrobacter nitroguajacolicus]
MNITTTPATFHSLRRVLIVHGYAAAPDAHWFPWLRDSLQTTGIGAAVVTLPTPDAPKAAAWTDAVAEAIGVPDAGTWIVAHSLGGITVLRALATLTEPWQLGGLILVSGFTGALKSLPVLDEYLSTDIDAERIAKNIGIRAMVRSDADAFVPAAASDKLAQRLNAELHIQPGAGHFLTEDGVSDLPLVLELMQR